MAKTSIAYLAGLPQEPAAVLLTKTAWIRPLVHETSMSPCCNAVKPNTLTPEVKTLAPKLGPKKELCYPASPKMAQIIH